MPFSRQQDSKVAALNVRLLSLLCAQVDEVIADNESLRGDVGKRLAEAVRAASAAGGGTSSGAAAAGGGDSATLHQRIELLTQENDLMVRCALRNDDDLDFECRRFCRVALLPLLSPADQGYSGNLIACSCLTCLAHRRTLHT